MQELEQAKGIALKFVAVRMRTQLEVEQQLRKKGYDTEIIAQVVAFLQAYQYLDDAAYCRSWIHDRVAFHPCGRQKMLFELSKKVTDRQLVSQSLDTYFSSETELELAEAAAYKKLESHNDISREQLSRFLYGRGYGGEIIRQVLQIEAINVQLSTTNRRQNDNNF